MKINQTLGKLTPAHPDLLPILASVREKYGIPEIAPGDATLAEFLGVDNMPDIEAIRDEIERELRKVPDFLPEKSQLIHKIIDAKENDFPYPEITMAMLGDVSARFERAMAKADFATREKLANWLIHSVALHQNKAVVKGYIPMTTADALITPIFPSYFSLFLKTQ